MKQSIITTFDAVRGLPTHIATRVVDAIWSAASRDAALNEALMDAIRDLMEHEEKMVTHYRILSDIDMDQRNDQIDNRMDQQQWQEEMPAWW